MQWTNEYFYNLLNYNYKLVKSPGDAPQFAPVQKSGGPASPPPVVGMLTTDVALTRDPAYLELVKLYAKDISQLENDFGAAWYKLVTRDMGPATRCINDDAPPPQVLTAGLNQLQSCVTNYCY
jgi:catalase (peroxidase I)